jgi:hypothetical protein
MFARENCGNTGSDCGSGSSRFGFWCCCWNGRAGRCCERRFARSFGRLPYFRQVVAQRTESPLLRSSERCGNQLSMGGARRRKSRNCASAGLGCLLWELDSRRKILRVLGKPKRELVDLGPSRARGTAALGFSAAGPTDECADGCELAAAERGWKAHLLRWQCAAQRVRSD